MHSDAGAIVNLFMKCLLLPLLSLEKLLVFFAAAVITSAHGVYMIRLRKQRNSAEVLCISTVASTTVIEKLNKNTVCVKGG